MGHILITGASSGIGRALALHLASLNHHVTAVGRRTEHLNLLTASAPQHIHTITADISLEADREKILQSITHTKLTHVVHNAATIEPFTNLSTLSLKEYRYQHSVNTEAPLFLTQKLLPNVAKSCRFLFITSGAAFSPYQGIGAYSISKAAVEMLWKAFKQEYENNNAAFFAGLRPGGVNTDMVALAAKQPDHLFPIIDQIKQRLKEGSLLEPDTVARFIEWVLFHTTNTQFEKSWNINDDEGKKNWHQYEKVQALL